MNRQTQHPVEEAIPFNRPYICGGEADSIAAAIADGHLSGDGPFTRRCTALLEEWFAPSKVLLTSSCTHALEMAALLLDIGPGDEVILPSFTFVSTANAFCLRGAKPVFCDVRPDTLNLDERRLPHLLTERTRAIVPVHYGGIPCAMESILRIAEEAGVAVVEDNAHGLYGRWRERPLGRLGALATQSFHATKNVNCGEGGALVVNDDALFQRAEMVREKGTDRSRFLRGEIDRYGWVSIGSSYLLSELQAAFLATQLEHARDIQEKRGEIWRRYANELATWSREHHVTLPTVPSESEPAWHTFYLLLPTAGERSAFIAWMKERGIGVAFHYLPLHTSQMGQSFGYQPGACPVTEDISARLVRLPLYAGLTASQVDRVIDAVVSYP